MAKPRQGAFLIAQMHQISGRIFSRMLKDFHIDTITPSQGRILFALWGKDDIPIQELARKTSLKKSTLTTMLDVLEGSGHIERVPSGADRRKIHIRLTARDNALQDAYRQVSRKMTDLCYAGFSEKEIDAFEESLKKILKNLKRSEQEMGGSAPHGERTKP
ncbi:MAG TPA: MarR family winged helix-turn-helix transcriptional regulator [Deltaproteobacteria bacterium]|nr:MarR family winged helix-turn-helix transcriptional regulator [Deltaproteobacteria bacterium]HQI00377.1 MarR family winged helix-turn-helix transcriptional regulator [Deltaproteobacteria bacterium]HQJ09520.1 MarR family winged helix-turn-helix transcriptional regulator [Deltaproteobacteria bacterium]